MNKCQTYCCPNVAVDEYHFYEVDIWKDREVEVVWYLCGGCCQFAMDVVECVSNLEREVEGWTT